MSNPTNKLSEEFSKKIPKIEFSEDDKRTFGKDNREKLIDSMYKKFKEIQNTPVIIPVKQFIKFLPLFQSKVLDSIDPFDKGDLDKYNKLCNEFTALINPYKEYHVDLGNGEYITFPPLFTPLNDLDPDNNTLIDKMHNYFTRCSDRPDLVGQVTAQFIQAFADSQNVNVIKAQMNKFKIIADKLNKDRLNISDGVEDTIHEDSDDDFLDFVDD